MGANHSHYDLDDTSSDEEEEQNSQTENEEGEEDESYEDAYSEGSSGKKNPKTPSSIDSIESKLRSLKLKYPSKNNNPDNNFANAVRLYLHVGGNTPNSKWVVSDKHTTYSFQKSDEDSDDEGIEREREEKDWILKVGFKIKAKVSNDLQFKSFGEKMRVDFVANGVWAMRFFTKESYDFFIKKFQDCLFENMYGYENNDENKARVYGKDFMNWAKPEIADDSIWENAEEDFDFSSKSPSLVTPVRSKNDLIEEFEEASDSGGAIQSLALGALDNSFLVSQSGIQVVKNFSHGIHGKGVYVNFGNERGNVVNSTPKKAVLMRAETNMMLMSPMVSGKPHTRGLHQLDIETGKIVTEWKFEKDGTDITMRDITNDSKGSQMDPTGSTFLGLDDNRLCRWDMRDKNGIVQDLTGGDGPVLNWAHGHQFSRGTNFQCFASTGDGSIAVGSVDGKIRLYSNNSMRMAKTSFPGLGSPITHVDVTYDGKWILGTSDTYLVLICTMFADKDGKVKTGFSGRMGNKISAPRLLKLTPLDSHMAGVNNKFRGAQFSWVTENGKQERHLVATVGKFSVIWNFQQVKDGSHECYQNQVGLKSCYCYKIVLKHDSIVESRFMHEKFAVSDSPEAPLVIATPSKVSSFSISTRR